jgi:lysophospholipase L1-like esterase
MKINFQKLIKPVFLSALLCITILFCAHGYAQGQSGVNNLTAYWRFSQSETTVFFDSVGDSDARCSGASCPQVDAGGKVQYALSFDGIDDRVEVPANSAFDFGVDEDLSIEFWMKADSTNSCSMNTVMVGRIDDSIPMKWWVGCDKDGQAEFALYDRNGEGGTIRSRIGINDGKWHHIVAMRDANTMTNSLYVDGRYQGSLIVKNTSGFESSNAALNIGWLNSKSGHLFSGNIDEVAIYKERLLDKEIKAHYYIPRAYFDTCSIPVKIMPLGDSITAGYISGINDKSYWVGYRQKLYGDLAQGGYQVDFVGSLNAGSAAQPIFDNNHEGHGGWCADVSGCRLYGGIAQNIYSWLTQNPAEIVLLHIGTNDISNNLEDPNDIVKILDEIDRFNPNISVILSKIINRTDGKSTQTLSFNDAVELVALDRIGRGDKIILVDHEKALDLLNDMSDAVHPNSLGYQKMADIWTIALNEILPFCGPAHPKIILPAHTMAAPTVRYRYGVQAMGNPVPTYRLVTSPEGMTIDAVTGYIDWVPLESQIGVHDVTVEALNSLGVDHQTFSLTVSSLARVWLESEQGGVVSPMVVGLDSQASSGGYMWVPNGVGNVMDPLRAGGTVSYTFEVPAAGDYVVWGRVMLDGTGGDDSFFVSMDSGPYALWDTRQGPTGQWGWDLVNNRGVADPVVYRLEAGRHTLVVKQREDGAKLDRVMVTNDLGYAPQGLEQ